ncbi:hypothetical protein [Clostridium sp. 'White wine YQ']|uniref:hypothetical protein n=1 Tax=Clostridium sp. 'White wine YQ' TaxID=3027474 RepID=UPI002365E3B1|nr:hypothetical protein [Clostridium sp. 'White wine YQ']MDD7792741.1 hypothetical protein [Clostridium sp. 'White wine YQ']
MKKVLLIVVIFSSLVLAGCGNKNNVTSSETDGNNKASVTNSTSTSTKDNIKTVKPGTVKELTPTQKAEVNNKLDSAISNIKDSLNSLDDVKDINLDSVN